MRSRPWRTKLTALALPLVLAASAVTTLAANGVTEDDGPPPDARLEGFLNNGTTGPLLAEQHGTAGTWFLSAIFGVLVIGVMCKNGKRSHLD